MGACFDMMFDQGGLAEGAVEAKDAPVFPEGGQGGFYALRILEERALLETKFLEEPFIFFFVSLGIFFSMVPIVSISSLFFFTP